jgi:hypothetical protein
MSDQENDKFKHLPTQIADYVHTEEFFNQILTTLGAISKPEVKIKMLYELMNYVMPKLKAKEDEEVQAIESINIGFSHAEKPKEEIEDGEEN